MKIAIYSRKSIFTGKGESIENQIEMCKNYISNMKIKGEFVIYEDEGFTGGNLDRPKFKKLINDVKSNKIDILVCYRLDRISRNVADFSSTLEILQSNGCDFISIKEQFDTSTPMGRAMIYIASVFAQLERETIAERVKDNMLQLAKMGKWSGGQLPLGFISEKVKYVDEELKERTFVKLVPLQEDMKIVKFIYNSYLQTNSILNTVKKVNIMGYSTQNNCKFDRSSIKRILSNPLYVKSNFDTNEYLKNKGYNVYGNPNGNGYLTYNKKDNKFKKTTIDKWIIAISNHKGVINSDDWLKVQKSFDTNIAKTKEFKSNRTGTGDNFTLFSGIIKCTCDHNMVMRYNNRDANGNPYIYYVCNSKVKKQFVSCGAPNIRADLIDMKIIDKVKSYDINALTEVYDDMLNELNEPDVDVIKTLLSEIAQKEKQSHNLIIQLSNSPNQDISNMIMNEITKLNDDMNKLKLSLEENKENNTFKKAELVNIKDFIANYFNFKKLFNITDDINAKRALVRSIVKEVRYDFESNNIDITYFV